MPRLRLTNEDIFDSLTDDECFAELPRKLAAAFGGCSALLHWTYPDGGGAVLQSSDLSQQLLDRYAQEFAIHDPWLRATDDGRFNERVISLEELVPAHEYAETLFYNEFVRPSGGDIFRCLGIRVDNRWGSGIVAIHRGRTQNAFASDTIRGLDEFAPALRRMMAVRGRLAATHRQLESMEAMLDHMGQAAMLVRSNGSLLHANTLGETLLRVGDAIVRRRGVLAAHSSRSTMKLRQAVDAACAPSGMAASALFVERPARRPLAVTVVPLRTGDGARYALLIVEHDASADGAMPRLQSLYGLTRAETEIGFRIADGTRPQAIAEERGVSVETVRSQIKSLSAKLGCTRQSEIVALVKALPATNLVRHQPTTSSY